MYTSGMAPCLIPNIPLATTTSGVLRAIDIGAAGADHGEYLCVKDCDLKEVSFLLTEELAGGSSTAPTVIFTKRPTPLSATGETVIATLTIPDATAIGKMINAKVEVKLAKGDSVEISHTIGSGTPTGIGIAGMLYNESPEDDSNNSDVSASA